VNGIVLNNTGSTAGLTITGTGAANSGGSIQNTAGHGVSLTNTTNFSANNLSITGADMAGIDGTEVTNFSFTNGQIVNAGDSRTNPLHAAIAFNDQSANENNVDGTLIITGNLLKDSYGGGVDVFNRSGTITNATVSNNTIDSLADEALSQEDGISFNLFGSASTVASLLKAQIEDNIITDFPSGNGISFLGAQTNIGAAPTGSVGVFGSSTNFILIDGNQLTGDPTLRFGGSGIQAGVEGRGVGNFVISNNTVTNVGTHGIATGNSGSTSVEYHNTVNANNFEAGGLGIRSASDVHIMVGGSTLATPTLVTFIEDNVIRNTTGGGIRVLQANSNGTAEVVVTGNDVANGGAGTAAIRVENGSSANPAFDPTLSLIISNNTTAANAPTPGGNTAPGILLFKRSTVASEYEFGIVGLTPSPSTNANTESYVAGLNRNANLGGGFWAGKRVSVDAGDNFVSAPDFTLSLLAAPGGVEAAGTGTASGVIINDGVLSQAELDYTVAAAIARWEAAGLSSEQIAALQSVTFTVADMSGLYLGSFAPDQITLDSDAAGHGWFIDSTPLDDAEFGSTGSASRLVTDPTSAPAGDIDLLTAVMHVKLCKAPRMYRAIGSRLEDGQERPVHRGLQPPRTRPGRHKDRELAPPLIGRAHGLPAAWC
jgi:hypothetical protein